VQNSGNSGAQLGTEWRFVSKSPGDDNVIAKF
jgi:hypothetical protein